MLSRSNSLRLQVESALSGRVLSPFRFHQPQPRAASTGIPQLDLLAGGFPRGCLTEIFGDPSSGTTSLLHSALAARTTNAESCALVDSGNSFDPAGAHSAGVALPRLLWVRCRDVNQALHSLDVLLHAGGFSLVAVDLSGAPARLVRQIPLNFWFRLRRTVENTATILLVLARESYAKTCASLVLRMERAGASWAQQQPRPPMQDVPVPGLLLREWTVAAELLRSKAQHKNVTVIGHRPEGQSAAHRARFAVFAPVFAPVHSPEKDSLPSSPETYAPNEIERT